MMPVYLPLALFRNQVFSGFSEAHSLSRTVVLVLIADVNQTKSFFITLYNVCAVPWGVSVPWGCSVPWGVILSTVGDVQYRGGYHDARGGIS